MMSTDLVQGASVPAVGANDVAERLQLVLGQLWSAHRRYQSAGSATTGGLSAAQLGILSSLVVRGPTRVSDLAVLLLVCKPTITIGVDRLARAGLVRRSSGSSDQREVYINITEHGLHVHRDIQAVRDELAAAALGQLSRGEQEALRHALPVLYGLAQAWANGDDMAAK